MPFFPMGAILRLPLYGRSAVSYTMDAEFVWG